VSLGHSFEEDVTSLSEVPARRYACLKISAFGPCPSIRRRVVGGVKVVSATQSGKGGENATMREVAALAGVSFKTVSRVVNAEPGVSPDLTARVRHAIQQLGYQQNHQAATLRRANGATATLGLLLDDVANPFSAALHRAVADIAATRHMLVFTASSDEDPERERSALHAFASRRVDGLIVVATNANSALLRSQHERGTPIVLVDRRLPGEDFDTVTVDNRGGARRAVEHLAAHGHRRVAFLADMDTIWTARERHIGYLEGIAAAAAAFDPNWVRHDLRGSAVAENVTIELLAAPEPPTAIFAAQNLITIGAIRALQRLGRQHTTALVGFDDIILAELLDPGITAIAQDPVALGRAAAELLFARLDTAPGPARHHVVPVSLLTRGSGEIPPPND
jgi:LacI family transcriptional regulator